MKRSKNKHTAQPPRWTENKRARKRAKRKGQKCPKHMRTRKCGVSV